MIVDPLCVRERSTKRDEAKASKEKEKNTQQNLGIDTLNENGDIEEDQAEPQEYPPRPHGCFDE